MKGENETQVNRDPEWPTSESRDENSECFSLIITNVIDLALKSGQCY